MKTIEVDIRKGGKRIDRVISESFPGLSSGAMFRAFRKRDIKVNGVRVSRDHVVNAGDRIDIYIVDDILEGESGKSSSHIETPFSIVYEDQNILIANKSQGIPVEPDRDSTEKPLIDIVSEYLHTRGENKGSFPPSLCHRLDRNTGGLIIIAKNNESHKIILQKIKSREIKKHYLCLVQGKMPKRFDELHAYLEKDEKKSRVFIKDRPSKGTLEIVTRYTVLNCDGKLSTLDVELVTGRTHQIRAHLAHIGHPIAGDGKYGSNTFNRGLKMKYQALWAYKLLFDFKDDAGLLNYLKGQSFEISPGFDV